MHDYSNLGFNDKLNAINSPLKSIINNFERGAFNIRNIRKDMLFVRGPQSATVATDLGTDWTNPNNSLIEDNIYAVSTSGSAQYTSSRLQLTNFNFNIPVEAKILGIKVSLIQLNNGPVLMRVELLKNNIIVGSARFPSQLDNPGVRKTFVIGSGTDIWGASWTPTDINNPNFGVSYRPFFPLGPGATASVDYISVFIYYSL